MKENPSTVKSAENRNKRIRGGALVRQLNPIKDFFGSFSSVRTKRMITVSVSFLLALVLAGTPLFPGTYPLGIAAAAAVSGVSAVLASLTGAVIGSLRIPAVGGITAAVILFMTIARAAASLYLSSDSLPDRKSRAETVSAVKNFAADLIRRRDTGQSSQEFFSAISRFSGIMLRENILVRITLSSCAALFAGAWSVVEGGYSYYDLFGAVFSFLITPLITYLIWTASETKNRYSPIREFAVYVCMALLTLSFSSMSPRSFVNTGFDFGAAFACAVAVVIPPQFGIHRGALAALACGLVLDPIYAPMYALAAVVSGAAASFSSANFAGALSKILSVISGGAVCTAWAIYTSGIDGLVYIFPPVVAVCAVVSPLAAYDLIKLPQTMFGGGLAALDSARRASSSIEQAALSDIKSRVGSMSDGLHSISAVLAGMASRLSKPTPHEARETVISAFDMRCPTCRIRDKCRRDGHTIEKLQDKMVSELMKNGVVSAAIVPSSAASSCASMGLILDDINISFGEKTARMKEGDKLAVSAADYSLAGDLAAQVRRSACEESEVDGELSKKLKRILSYNDFHATNVSVWGKRMKHIYVGDIDLSSTRMGGDDIRRLFERTVGERLSAPEFELDGASLSMKMHTVRTYTCTSGMFSCAASSVHKYCNDINSCGADSGENPGLGDMADTKIRITDAPPEDVCGDVITEFEAGGKQYMIISDGMGSGREAALTSGVVVSLLERLIRSGAELETSLKMLNGIVRSCGRECSATVDIAEIDCVSGEAKFIKSGAAPSFVLRDGSIFRLQSKTVPIGIIRALDAEMIKFDVREGDTVVMISDGAARSYDEAPWLLDLMTDDERLIRGDERTAAVTIVAEAAIRGSVDDITAGVMRVRRAE